MAENFNPVICAIDLKDSKSAIQLCNKIKTSVGMIKLGLEFYTSNGPEGVQAIKALNIPIFLDLKLHDIPNTVAQSVRACVALGINMLTIHSCGGKAMMQAAAQAAKDEAQKLQVAAPLILGVTVLTSMDSHDLEEIGVKSSVNTQVLALAKLAKESGLDGVICSPHEIEFIKQICGEQFKVVVPGIRPGGSVNDDQKRVMNPKAAIKLGANYLVIGRPITQAADPAIAARDILQEIRN